MCSSFFGAKTCKRNGSQCPHVFKFFGVQRASATVQVFRFSTCKRNGSESPCAPPIDRDLEVGGFSVNTAILLFLGTCNIITNYFFFDSETVFPNKVIITGTSCISERQF